MQASQIVIGKDYVTAAGQHMRVTEMHTVRDGTTAKNYAVGWTPHQHDSGPQKLKVEVKNIIGLVDDIAAEKAAKEAREAERRRAEQAQSDKQWQAVTLLAEAIGAQAVRKRYDHRNPDKWDSKAPAVIVDGADIEINAEAIDDLIKFLGWALNTRKMLESSVTS